jgi:hypothetical protein
VVLKGRDPDLGRDVALKVLREDLRENAGTVRRFVEEAQIGGGEQKEWQALWRDVEALLKRAQGMTP